MSFIVLTDARDDRQFAIDSDSIIAVFDYGDECKICYRLSPYVTSGDGMFVSYVKESFDTIMLLLNSANIPAPISITNVRDAKQSHKI